MVTSSTLSISNKIIPRVHNKLGKIILHNWYSLYQRTFPNYEYGLWLEIGFKKSFFVRAVRRATMQNIVALGRRMGDMLFRVLWSMWTQIHFHANFTLSRNLWFRSNVLVMGKVIYCYLQLQTSLFTIGLPSLTLY